MSQNVRVESGVLPTRFSAERDGSNSQFAPAPTAAAAPRGRSSKRPRSEDTHEPAAPLSHPTGDGISVAEENVVGGGDILEGEDAASVGVPAGSPRARVVVNVDDSEEDDTGAGAAGGGMNGGVVPSPLNQQQGAKTKPVEAPVRRAITISSDTTTGSTAIAGGGTTPSIRVPPPPHSVTMMNHGLPEDQPTAAAAGGAAVVAMTNSNTRCATEVVFGASPAATGESELSLSCTASQPPAVGGAPAVLHHNDAGPVNPAVGGVSGTGAAAVATVARAATGTSTGGKRNATASGASGVNNTFDSPPPRVATGSSANAPEQTTAAPFLANVATTTTTATATLAKAGMSRKELKQRTLDAYQPPPPVDVMLRKEIEEKTIKMELLQQRIASLEAEVGQKSALIKLQEERLAEHQGRELKYREALCTVMQDLASSTRRDARRQQHAQHFELGHVITTTSNNGAFGSHLKELWVEGNRFREYIREQEQLAARETELEGERATLEKRLQALRRAGGTVAAITESLLKVDTATSSSLGVPSSEGSATGGSATGVGSTSAATTATAMSPSSGGAAFNSGGGGFPAPAAPPAQSSQSGNSTTAVPSRQSAIMDEAIDVEDRLQSVRREAEAITAAKEALKAKQLALESEKKVFLKEIRRISEEDASEFATQALMGRGRYVMLSLLGKGGFSEVWRAFDLQEAQYVACKIHKVGRDMSTAQKHHYVRHAHRELEILRRLDHPRVTRLLDVFEPENTTDTFVAVMEYCGGTDLDTFLKSRGVLRELDAKTIMVQIISALRHMADQPTPVIHYDLKPANILFVSSSPLNLEIKITDFGLSKIMSSAQEAVMNSRHAEGIELTSQGTGTYWYLPPECFDTTRTPIVNGKVDVWAAGIIFYQMLYGRRPFAEGISQRQIWQDKLIAQLAQKPLEFPTTSASGTSFKVSDDAKAVIQRCLTPSVVDRCDIYQLSADPYFRKIGRTSKALGVLRNSASNAATAAAAAAASSAAAMPPSVSPGDHPNIHGMPTPLPRP